MVSKDLNGADLHCLKYPLRSKELSFTKDTSIQAHFKKNIELVRVIDCRLTIYECTINNT